MFTLSLHLCHFWFSPWDILGELRGLGWNQSICLFFFPQLLIFSFKVTSTMEYFFSSDFRARSESWREDMPSSATFPWACRRCGGWKSSFTLMPTVQFLDCMSMAYYTAKGLLHRQNWGQPKLSRWACDITRKKDAKELVSEWEEEDEINRGTLPAAQGVRCRCAAWVWAFVRLPKCLHTQNTVPYKKITEKKDVYL